MTGREKFPAIVGVGENCKAPQLPPYLLAP
jgi:hypothetical protein